MDEFNAVWERPETPADQGRDRRPRRLGRPRPAEPVSLPARRRRGPSCAVRRGARRTSSRRDRGARRLLRRRRLAGAARRHGLRGAASRRCGWSASTVDHGLQDGLGRARRRRSSRRWPRSGPTRPSARPGPRRGRPARARGGGPRGALRRARGGRRAVRRRRGAARPHPRRPGRDRAARADPRLGRPLARRHAARRSTGSAGRCSTSRRAETEDRLPGRGDRVLGRPAQHRPARSPASGSGRTVLPVLEHELGPGVAAALARTADQLRARHGGARPSSAEAALRRGWRLRRGLRAATARWRGRRPTRPSPSRVLRLAALEPRAVRDVGAVPRRTCWRSVNLAVRAERPRRRCSCPAT